MVDPCPKVTTPPALQRLVQPGSSCGEGAEVGDLGPGSDVGGGADVVLVVVEEPLMVDVAFGG